MNIEIRKLAPEHAEDYVRFFDTTPHDDCVDEHKCYCVCWCSDDCEGRDYSTVQKRREYALRYVKDGASKVTSHTTTGKSSVGATPTQNQTA